MSSSVGLDTIRIESKTHGISIKYGLHKGYCVVVRNAPGMSQLLVMEARLEGRFFVGRMIRSKELDSGIEICFSDDSGVINDQRLKVTRRTLRGPGATVWTVQRSTIPVTSNVLQADGWTLFAVYYASVRQFILISVS